MPPKRRSLSQIEAHKKATDLSQKSRRGSNGSTPAATDAPQPKRQRGDAEGAEARRYCKHEFCNHSGNNMVSVDTDDTGSNGRIRNLSMALGRGPKGLVVQKGASRGYRICEQHIVSGHKN